MSGESKRKQDKANSEKLLDNPLLLLPPLLHTATIASASVDTVTNALTQASATTIAIVTAERLLLPRFSAEKACEKV